MARSNNNLVAFLLIAIIGLLGLSGYLWFQSSKMSQNLEAQKKEIHDIEKINAELEQDYQTALNSLEELRGDNDELNNLIDKQKTELGDQKKKISSLLYAKKNLGEAQLELENLKTQASIYISEVKKLREENNQLVLANSTLLKSNKSLETANDSARQTIQVLDKNNEQLTKIKEQITEENTLLAKKVDIAEAIKVSSIKLQGFKLTKDGKERSKSRAKRIDKLKTCFTAEANLITENSNETFQVRIIDPAGETLYLESAGSGELTKKMDGSTVRYTVEKAIPYDQGDTEACIEFIPNFELSKGLYNVEMYNKGYLVGKGEYQIK